jgi:hypothetical protein
MHKIRHIELTIAFLFALIPVFVKLIYFPQYPGTDDAFIHAALVKNILSGNGWAINPHNPVNMSTSPLFTLLLCGVSYFSRDIINAGIILSSIFTIATILTTFLITQILFKSLTVRMVVVLTTVFNIHLWRWNGTVMETTLAMFLVVLVIYFYLKFKDNLTNLRIVGLALIHVFAVLTRPELIILLLSMLIFVRLNSPIPIRSFVPKMTFAFIVFLLPWLIFSALYFHSIIPSTYYAKTSSFHWVNWSVFQSAFQILFSAFGPAIVFSLLLVILFLYKILKNKQALRFEIFQNRRIFTPLLSFPLLVFLFYYFMTKDLQSSARYFLPMLSVVPILFGIFLEWSLGILSKGLFYITASFLCCSQVIIAIYLAQTRVIPVLNKFQDNYVSTMNLVTSYLAKRCQQQDYILIEKDIGVISYCCNSAFIIKDGGALASPELIGLTLSEKINLLRPRYVVESLGMKQGDMIYKDDRLKLVYSKIFASHGVNKADISYWCNLYEVKN